MKYELLATDGTARRGRLTLNHGTVDTPAFMPVGTYGSVKGISPQDLRDIGAQICLGNTFHLWLRPGLEVMDAHKDRKSTRLNSSHIQKSRMPSSA